MNGIDAKDECDAGAKLLGVALSTANKTDKPKTFMCNFVMAILCIMLEQEKWDKGEAIEFLSNLSSGVVKALEDKRKHTEH